jgi:hypothetical protein
MDGLQSTRGRAVSAASSQANDSPPGTGHDRWGSKIMDASALTALTKRIIVPLRRPTGERRAVVTFLPWSEPMERKSSKRSNEEKGSGLGIRKQAVIAVLVCLALVVAALYLVEINQSSSSVQPEGVQPGEIVTVSTTGIDCNDSSMPQTAQDAEQEPAFTNLSAGLCYNYLGQNTTQVQGATVLSFGYYNGTISYPCGVSPLEVPQSVIQDTVNDGQDMGKLQMLNSSEIFREFYPQGNCPTSPPVEVVSVTDSKALIPAVPELNLTVSSPVGPTHVTSLTAILALDGGYQRFGFKGVTQADPLPQGVGVSAIEIVTGLGFTGDQVFPMTLEGTLSNGQTFSYGVQVQITGVQ